MRSRPEAENETRLEASFRIKLFFPYQTFFDVKISRLIEVLNLIFVYPTNITSLNEKNTM